jgi:hypothetical protein
VSLSKVTISQLVQNTFGIYRDPVGDEYTKEKLFNQLAKVI